MIYLYGAGGYGKVAYYTFAENSIKGVRAIDFISKLVYALRGVMARLPRLSVAGAPQHVVQRGNNRQASFFGDQDYTLYLDKLKEYSSKYGVQVHGYILMTKLNIN